MLVRHATKDLSRWFWNIIAGEKANSVTALFRVTVRAEHMNLRFARFEMEDIQ